VGLHSRKWAFANIKGKRIAPLTLVPVASLGAVLEGGEPRGRVRGNRPL